LLLGVLTYVAWSHDQFLNRSGTLSRLMMMAMSLVYDLRMNKPVPSDVHMLGAYSSDFHDVTKDPDAEASPHHLERQRAVLGCFLLSSIVSSYFTQIDAMRWTSRMEDYLRAVEANKECPTDAGFAFRIRLQLLAQQAGLVREQRDVSQPHTPASSQLPSVHLYFRVLQNQLRELQNSLPLDLQQDSKWPKSTARQNANVGIIGFTFQESFSLTSTPLSFASVKRLIRPTRTRLWFRRQRLAVTLPVVLNDWSVCGGH
jgi:hypothetical protein